jgi:predicted DsbA family dithiol-disulfide isomerase
MPVEIRYYTDPACSWSWGSEPKLRHLQWEFGDQLEFRSVMGGLARSYGPDYRDTAAGITGDRDCFDGLISHWLDVAAETGMPLDPRIWRRTPLASTYPACQGVKAASEQGPAAAAAYLRRAREAIFLERRKLDHAAALIAEAGAAGLDSARFEIDLGSHAITEAFAADLDEVRDVPDEARAQGKTGETEGHERVSFPSALFCGGDGSRHGVWGWQPYERYREAAIAAGAQPVTGQGPTVLEALERFGRCATRELEELTGTARPLLEAELWTLAGEWKLKPMAVLTGTIWEPA